MIDKLEALLQKYLRLEKEISDPELVTKDQKRWLELTKEHASLGETIETYRNYKEAKLALNEAKDIISEKADPELVELAKEEADELEERLEELEQRLKLLLVPKDPNDEKNVIMEIRGGAGGDEAALFALEIFKMYTRYAEARRWKTEVLDSHYTDIGGKRDLRRRE